MSESTESRKIRLFVALPVSEGLKRQAGALPRKGLENARWNHPEDLHITLRFIGDVEPGALAGIQESLGRVRTAPFHVEVAGLDFFNHRQGILHARVQSTRKLENLAVPVTDRIRACGFDFPVRTYVPHVTLARLKKGLAEYTGRHHAKIAASWPADRFFLYRSAQPDATGVRYKILAEYRLTGA